MTMLDFNTGINFGAKGNLNEYSPVGFSDVPDAVSRWSDASLARLTFRLPFLRHDAQFTIEVFPFLADGLIPQQDCWVYFNGLFVHYRSIKTPVELTFTISPDLVNTRANQVSFALPNATSPKDLRLGNDVRALGLAFVSLTASPP